MKWCLLVGMVIFSGVITELSAGIFTVSQDGRGEYSSVQAAVTAAKAGDEVIILDFATYNEQVTIDSSRNRLILRSENPRLRMKPVIRFKDTVNVGPRTYAESQDQSKITFDMNGACRIIRAQGVTIDGIIFDGGAPAPYGYDAIWGNRSPLFSGNAALTLNVAGDAMIRNCEFKNAFYGVYIKDRNEGGIYANANPADLQPQLVVPLSGFGKSGNHIIERNRIHHNSWGIFIESAWDLGSTIRYNLIYENNIADALAEKIKLMKGSDNQSGGAIVFKDLLLTPMAIYNNTFFRNYIILCADWQVGGTNLVFNNIFGKPYKLDVDGNPPFSAQALDKALPYRTFNCLYSVQEKTPKPDSQLYETPGITDPETNIYVKGSLLYKGYRYLSIMNPLPDIGATSQTFDVEIPLSSGPVISQVVVDWVRAPGAIIKGNAGNPAFPVESQNRWYEMAFQSEDEESPLFLTPAWDDSITRALVVDQGWVAGGIRDADGSIADIGAIPLGGIPETEIIIKPKDPVFINGGTSAKVSFSLLPLAGTIQNPKIKYVKWVRNIPYIADGWGNAQIAAVPATNIIDVAIPPTPLVVGSNILTFTIPKMDSAYGFFDIIIEGTDEKGTQITTNVGFLPYREIDYVFDVVIMDVAGTKELTQVSVGETVQLWITPKRLDGMPFDVKIDKVSVALGSNFPLLTGAGEVFAIPQGIQGTSKNQVMFTKVPQSGFDGVSVNGMFTNPNDPEVFFAIRGSSKDIKIIPGPAEKIEFYDPHSKGVATVDPGTPRPVTVQAFDRYDNKATAPTSIAMVSQAPDIGKIVTSPVMTDSTGLATFFATVTKGDMYDTFPVVATLLANATTDNAKLVVGKPRDRIWILFDDTLQYDENVKISTCAGERVKITIIASKNGNAVEAAHSTKVALDLSPGLALFGTSSPLDTARLTQVTLQNGKATVWLMSTVRSVSNGSISAFAPEGGLVSGYREGVSFISCNISVKSAAYFTTGGFGSVNRMDMYFEKKIKATEIPDSMLLKWPSEAGEVRMVKREQCTLDALDSTHVTVLLPQPFSAEVTRFTGSNAQLGKYFWWNPATPDAASQVVTFAIDDSVGPLLKSATLVERLGSGKDTMYISFTETVFSDVVKGQSLVLVKSDGTSVPLTVAGVIPQSAQVVIAVIDDLGESRPREGDSLKILSTGPIVDGSKNHAHLQNRAVAISVRQVPADIVSAAYYDVNADGVIDRVIAHFNKKVASAQIVARLVWDGDSAVRTLSLQDFTYLDGDTAMVVQMALPADLFKKSMGSSKTSGSMALRVTFTAFTDNNIKISAVLDKAAPVLTKVRYFVGGVKNGTTANDTIKFVLSEPAQVDALSKNPLEFKNSTGPYPINVLPLSLLDGNFQYVVNKEGVVSPVLPVLDDSAWIATASSVVKDISGNGQVNPQNKRVVVELVLPEFEPEVRVGPNPFISGGMNACHIIVRPQTGLAIVDVITASVDIYDKVGNRVISLPKLESRTQVDLAWNGCNSKGRYVGNGTYLAILKCSFIVKGIESVKTPQRILIGVTR